MNKIFRAILLAAFLLSSCGTPTPTPAPLSIEPVRVADAPRLAAQSPLDGERLLLEPTIDLTFDRDMNKAATESAWTFSDSNGDPVAGKTSWPDARTLRFIPDGKLAPASTYVAAFSTAAVDLQGNALAEELRLEFRTVDALAVGQVFPADYTEAVDLESTITVIFNRPVVPLTIAEEQADLPQPIAISPAVAGTGDWVNSSVYVFQPEKLLDSGTRYTVRVEAGLEDTSGTALEESFQWQFTTRAPGIGYLSLKNGQTNPKMDVENILLDQAFLISFLQPMDQKSVAEAVSLTDRESGKPFPTRLKWNEASTLLTIEPVGRYRISGYYQLELTSAAQAQDGSPLREGLNFRFSTLPLPGIKSVTPSLHSTAEYFNSWITITFKSPMDFETIKSRVSISPKPAGELQMYYNQYNWEMNIYGLKPSTDYIVRLMPGMTDLYGNSIQSEYSFDFKTGKMRPSADLAIPQSLIYRAKGEQTFFFRYTNINLAEIGLYPISFEQFAGIQRGDVDARQFTPGVPALHRWTPDVTGDPNQVRTAEYDLKDATGGPLAPGYYFVELTSPIAYDSNIQDGRIIIVATDNLTLKTTQSEALAWLTDLETGKPTANVTVIFMDDKGREIAKAKTDKNGLAYADGLTNPYYARTDDKLHVAFAAQYWGTGVSMSSAGVYPDFYTTVNAPFAFVYTERPLYRPGQDVFFKGILRQNDDLHYSLPKQDEVYVTIEFEGEQVYTKTLGLNDMGTFTDSFHLGDDISLGTYDISVRSNEGAETAYSYNSFRVAEYRKPEFQVTVAPNVTDVLAGDKFSLALDAAYYSGGNVSNAGVSWFFNASSAAFGPSSAYSGYSFTDWDRDSYDMGGSPAGKTLKEGDSMTDENGHLELSHITELGAYKNGSTVSFSANVTDVSGNLVSGGTSVHVHPSLLYAGIRSQSYIGVQDEPQAFDLVVLDWDSNPIAGQSVSVEIVERQWFSAQEKDDQGTLRWVTTVKEIPVARNLAAVTDADGLASVSFVPTKGGIYKATVTVLDAKRNKQQSSAYIWVAGKDYIPWRQTNDRSFNLVVDKDSYSPGDTAKILIAQPFEGENYALVTYERGHIYKQDVVLLKGNSTIYELPIEMDMAPVAYVSVVVVKGAESGSAPDFKMGMTRLNVDLAQQELNVSIQTDKESAGPNEKVTYTVTVKDYAGKPVQAEVSLALVDKAVLALAPSNSEPMLSAFYPERAYSVRTALGIVMNSDDYNANYRKTIADGEASGSGGGGKGEGYLGVISVRQDFRDTAFYEAQVETDRSGQATVTVTLPENLTTWQMKARAVTSASLVGETTHELMSTKPLFVQMQAPRFFIVEDTAQVGATVHNNTKAALKVTVTLDAQGVELTSTNEQTIEVPAGQQAYVTWNVKVKSGVERVDFTVKAVSGKYEDISKPALGTLAGQGIPVYTLHVTEPVGTSGMLRGADSITEAIQLPTSMPYKDATVSVELSPSLAASMTGGLTYLEDYPYLCMEQTISRFLPNVVTVRALELAGQPSAELRANLDSQVSTALQRIYAKQLYDGGWNWWNGDDSDPQMTAYVLLGLIEARAAGYSIDEDVAANAQSYLEGTLTSLAANDAEWQYNRQAFAVYVLARAGLLPSSQAAFMFENRAHLSQYGKAYLAQAFFLDDPKATRIKTLMSDLSSAAVLSAAGAHWEEATDDYWNWNTDVRTTAIVLDAFVRIDPEAVLTADTVRWLMAHRGSTGWGSTQDTAWTLIALTDWLTASKEFDSEYAYAVGLNGEVLQRGDVTSKNLTEPVTLELTLAQLTEQVNLLVITRGAGNGNLYYTSYLTAALPVESVKALDRGISVSRQYFTLDDSKHPITGIKRGDLVRVRVTIVAPSALHYVVVDDPLPAGLQAVDSSLLTDVQVPSKYSLQDFTSRGWGWWFFDNVELRDEKVVLSADYLPAGTYVFTYMARAGTAGTFNVIPTTASEFYFPDVYGRGDGTVFVVKP
jgi:uncharacterized protein YfaS (alpha-2-macroglobulin family)